MTISSPYWKIQILLHIPCITVDNSIMDLSVNLVSSVIELKNFLSSVQLNVSLYLDLEGNNLGRHGSISLMTILVRPGNQTHLIDIQALGGAAFTTPSEDGATLKALLENPQVPKFLWDLRNDADALWSFFQVGIAGVTDIQLLENASRVTRDKTFLSGLDNAIRYDLVLGTAERERWLRTKNEIKTRMPAGVFSTRPLDSKAILYCANDVAYLPALQAVYERRISAPWLAKAKEHSQKRAVEAHSPDYDPQSRDKARGPWAGLQGSGDYNDRLSNLAEAMWDVELESNFDDDWQDDGPSCSADVDDFGGAFDDCWTKY